MSLKILFYNEHNLIHVHMDAFIVLKTLWVQMKFQFLISDENIIYVILLVGEGIKAKRGRN